MGQVRSKLGPTWAKLGPDLSKSAPNWVREALQDDIKSKRAPRPLTCRLFGTNLQPPRPLKSIRKTMVNHRFVWLEIPQHLAPLCFHLARIWANLGRLGSNLVPTSLNLAQLDLNLAAVWSLLCPTMYLRYVFLWNLNYYYTSIFIFKTF